jgi:hypothetical protein
MNIFVLSKDPYEIAKHMPNIHLNKMLTETRQLLELTSPTCTKVGHKNHPCAVWARASDANYNWLLTLGLSIYAEWVKRRGTEHKSGEYINALAFRVTNDELVEWPQVMPEEFRGDDVVEAYRRYYAFKLRSFRARGICKFKFKS